MNTPRQYFYCPNCDRRLQDVMWIGAPWMLLFECDQCGAQGFVKSDEPLDPEDVDLADLFDAA